MPATKSRTKSTPKPSSVKPPTTTTTTPSPSKTQNPTPPLRDRLRRTPGRVNSTNNINTMETPSNTKPRRGKNIINKLIESKEETCKLNNEEDEEEAFGTPLDGDMNGELKKDGHRRFDSDDEEEQEEEELNNEDLEEQIEQEEIEIQQDIDSDSNDEIIASDSEDDEQVEALTLSDAKKALQQKQEKERVIAQQCVNSVIFYYSLIYYQCTNDFYELIPDSTKNVNANVKNSTKSSNLNKQRKKPVWLKRMVKVKRVCFLKVFWRRWKRRKLIMTMKRGMIYSFNYSNYPQ